MVPRTMPSCTYISGLAFCVCFRSARQETEEHRLALAAAFALLFIANAIKWPNAVLQLNDMLASTSIEALAALGPRDYTDLYRGVLQSVDSVAASEMHRRMDRGTVCSQSGLVKHGKELGLLGMLPGQRLQTN